MQGSNLVAEVLGILLRDYPVGASRKRYHYFRYFVH